MSVSSIPVQDTRFKIGWIVLLIVAALMTLNHAVLIFVLGQPDLFTGFAFFNAFAFIVIMIPFRRGEKWAWVTTWLLPIGLALPAINSPALAVFYFSAAGLCALGLLLTVQDFFSKR